MRWRFSLALILSASALQADPVTFLRKMRLADLGGVSAIEVEPGGRSAIVLSDDGTSFRFSITRNGDTGHIEQIVRIEHLFPGWDAEGLAISATQTYFSYEGPAVVATASGKILPSHPEFVDLSTNGALEALAVTPDGVLYTIPENPRNDDGPFPVYRFQDDTWTVAARLPRSDSFLPTGADFGPDGLLYILERSFSLLGFRAQIRRVDLNADPPRTERLLTTFLGTHDNLEGLSVWRSDSGATCLTIVSDDNFLSIQTSELVEYALTETLAVGATCD